MKTRNTQYAIRTTITALFLIAAIALAAPLFAANIDYYGYEEWGGSWSDAEKTPSNTEDDLLCWAAASANILAWSNWGYPSSESFTGTDDIFAYYQDHWTDVAGMMEYGWKWWFDGVNPAQGYAGWAQVDVPGGDFWTPPYSFADYFYSEDTDSLVMSAIDSYLHDGYGVTLAMYGPGGHAITCWGYRYDDSTGNYLGVYVSDSDDNKSSDTPPDTLRYYDVANSAGTWYLQNFYGSNSWYIGEVQALDQMARDMVTGGLGDLLLGYGETEIKGLSKLYNDRGGYTVAIDDIEWSYLADEILPGDTGYALGEGWTYDGNYYIKLGSGLEGAPLGGAVPELPMGALPFLGAVLGAVFARGKKG